MSARLVLITGAPETRSLDWEYGLLDAFSEPFLRFAGLDVAQASTPGTPALTPTSTHPSWRSIPIERQHLATGYSQDHGWQNQYQGASFLDTSDLNLFLEEFSQPTGQSQGSSAESAEQILSQFYEHSYNIHEDFASLQIAGASDLGASLNSAETSFDTTATSLFDSPMQSFSGRDIPTAGHLTALKGIPNASHLHSIHPQTMTVNLIVGIISIPPPRTIKTRRGANIELIEMLVGDETKSGFGINFWLSSSPVEGDMRGALRGLRPQDVILVRNVALSSFRGKVYGQSLTREMTKVHLFYRNRIDRTDLGGYYHSADLVPGESLNPQVDKTRRVREWVLRFVGAGAGQKKIKRQISHLIREVLPPDTQ